jgi:serine/threonine-protein kinase
MMLPVGKKLGRYEIRSKLGEGGMAEVYLAQDTKLDRKVALKVLPADVAANRDRMERFVREAKAAAALNHPNIAHIYEIGEVDGLHFIAMEYIEGDTLREKIHSERTDLRKLLRYLQNVAEGLAKAHAAGIVHRDLKPDNIMITVDGHAKILDFGLAKLIEQHATPTSAEGSSEVATAVMPQHSTPGTVMGTVGYMSPEQAQGKTREIDHRSDIFSFGCILYEAAIRQRAFEGKDALDSLHKIVHGPTPQISGGPAGAPDELQRIVRRCLAKDPEKRYQSMKDVAIELEELQSALKGAAEPVYSSQPALRGVAAPAIEAAAGLDTGWRSAASTRDSGLPRSSSSAEYIANEIRRHKKSLAVMVLLAVTVTAVGLGYYFHAKNSRVAIDSIAVLPFKNTTADQDTEYLSDGISESLINSLSQLPGVKVIASSSSFKYKDKDADPQDVANALGVEAILTGRVLRRGDNLLISVELVNAQDRTQVWGEQYNRNSADLLAVQSEISREIAEKLRLRLSASDQQQLTKRERVNPQAYELMLKGLYYRRKGGTENSKKAVEYYNQAIDADPTYALAYAELSVCYLDLAAGSVLDPKEFTPKAEAAARKAVDLDESLADAHYALALSKRDAWEWASAEREYQRAIELNPNLAAAHLRYAFYLSLVGRHKQGIAEIERARELDPLSSAVNANVGYVLYLARQYDQAIESLQKTRELDRDFPPTQNVLGFTYAAKGMYAEAIAAYQEAIRLGNKSPSLQIYLGAAYARAGDREKGRAILEQLRTSESYVSPCELAILHAALGEREPAFASLEKAYAAHDPSLQYLGIDPAFDSLRADPRFDDLVRRVGLPL